MVDCFNADLFTIVLLPLESTALDLLAGSNWPHPKPKEHYRIQYVRNFNANWQKFITHSSHRYQRKWHRIYSEDEQIR